MRFTASEGLKVAEARVCGALYDVRRPEGKGVCHMVEGAAHQVLFGGRQRNLLDARFVAFHSIRLRATELFSRVVAALIYAKKAASAAAHKTLFEESKQKLII